MKMWAAYLREREGKEVIETPDGFAVFKSSAPELYLVDVYLAPERRRMGAAVRLMRLAEEQGKIDGCRFMTTTIDARLGEEQATKSIRAILACGFRFHSSQADRVVFIKEL